MKPLLILILAVAGFSAGSFSPDKPVPEIRHEPLVHEADEPLQYGKPMAPLRTDPDPLPNNTRKRSGPQLETYYFEDWHYPHGAVLDGQLVTDIWEQIEKLPEDANTDDVNSWRLLGPYGSDVPSTTGRFSGRVRDIEIGNAANPLIAAASGGLWSYFWILPYCLNEDMQSLACGSFSTKPGSANTIILGTGEPQRRTGTGIYRSTNGGNNWTKLAITPQPTGFYKVRFDENFTSRVHVASTGGYYRSTNEGSNWTRTLTGTVTDIAINSVSTNTIYAGRWGDGIYKSTNNGENWTKLSSPGLPVSDIGRISLTVGTSNSNKVYAAIAKDSDDGMLGVYMSTNAGSTWTDVSPPENIFGNQGWYNNVMGVCPTNSNIVLAGGVRLWRSTNSGSSWTKLLSDNIHADQHVVEWSEDGQTVYIGNDGGIAVSTDQGLTFSNTANYLPITQYVNIDVGVSNRGVIYGGSQDNGFTGTTDGGQVWQFTKGGDGGGLAIDPFNSLNIYGTAGFYTGSWAFKRYRSTDRGFTWAEINNGVDPDDLWYTQMRSDRTSPIKLYTNTANFVYTSSNQGTDWTKLNPGAFAYDVRNIEVSKYTNPHAIVYVPLISTNISNRLKVYENGAFSERTTGIPSGLGIRSVAAHITNTSKAYALINGIEDGEKVYKTTNRGISWTNVSGDLPNVPVGDLLPHPNNDNLLYLGTEMGCYKTTNGGQNWMRWNNGMPEAAIVTEMKWIDSTFENGKFYVIAGTYGRSIYARDVAGDDPVNTLSLVCHVEGMYNSSTNLSVRDTFRVYLRNSVSPYAIVDSAKGYQTASGNLSLQFFNSQGSTQYYIQIAHRNGLETWSANTFSFSNYEAYYNMQNAQNSAFGSNIKQIDNFPVKFGIYSGEVNKDGVIDVSDLTIIDNDVYAVEQGYITTDLNGDDIADIADLAIVDNNVYNFVSVIRP